MKKTEDNAADAGDVKTRRRRKKYVRRTARSNGANQNGEDLILALAMQSLASKIVERLTAR